MVVPVTLKHLLRGVNEFQIRFYNKPIHTVQDYTDT